MSAGTAVETSHAGGDSNMELSKAEAEVYDRQIRLWGLEAQQKLHMASGLLYGLSGVGAEIAKNLMLCGLRSLTLMDGKAVEKDDLDSNFLLGIDSVGKNRAKASASRAQALNPMVRLEVVESDLNSISPEFISRFTIVVLCDQTYDDVLLWNDRCRQLKVGFIACSVFGWMGYSFFDFNDHLFLSAVEKKQEVCFEDGSGSFQNPPPIDLEAENLFEKKFLFTAYTVRDNELEKIAFLLSPGMISVRTEMDEKALQYPRFEDAINVDWSKKQFVRKSKRLVPCSFFPIKAMLRAQKERKLTDSEEKNVAILTELWKEEVLSANQEVEKQSVQPEKFDYLFGPQFSPTCAVVGGLAGQEAIKALSESKGPLQNVFIYSALDSTGFICHFPPPV